MARTGRWTRWTPPCRALLWVGAWALAVVSVAGLSWAAIDSAGRQVIAEPPMGDVALGEPSGVHGGVPTTSPTEGAPEAERPTTTAAPTASTTDEQPGRTSARRTATVAATTVSRMTPGGSMTVTCVGPALSRWSVLPANGWSVTRRSVGSGQVVVGLVRNGRRGNGGRGGVTAVTVRGRCEDGGPAVDVTVS